MAEMMIDELNIVSSVKKYFSCMDISNKQYDDRIGLAEEYKDIMLFIFTYIEEAKKYDISNEYIKALAISKALDSIGKYAKIDDYLTKLVNETIDSIIAVTEKNIENEYYLSDKRATFIACDQSNSIMNHADFIDALSNGRTMKKWIDVKDRKERPSHNEIGGTEIPINSLFYVGNSFMLYPKDTSHGASAEEIVNCRCSIIYY